MGKKLSPDRGEAFSNFLIRCVDSLQFIERMKDATDKEKVEYCLLLWNEHVTENNLDEETAERESEYRKKIVWWERLRNN